MLNTKKLLYILPDSTYIAELVPAKKPNTFSIQAFRQINGNFLDENEFIAENIEKLFKKIEAEEYHLILPDFLFTNTIVDIAETTDTGVKKYLTEKLLPSLDLSKETHQIDTFVLTEHQGKSKVQLSALEKTVLAPIQEYAAAQNVKILGVSPLSWTIKSVVSLEPSLSTIQIGERLYLAQHYIGVDQTISFSIHETDNIVETVKTLKGAEPNIQTMYLLTNALVESEIKEKLSGTLPIQQLSNFAEEQEGIPSYVKQIIEAGMKTLSISEYPVPKFELGKFTGVSTSTTEEVSSKKTEDVAEEPDADDAELPKPSQAAPVTQASEPKEMMPVAQEITTVKAEKIEHLEEIKSPAPTAPKTETIPPSIPLAEPKETPPMPTPITAMPSVDEPIKPATKPLEATPIITAPPVTAQPIMPPTPTVMPTAVPIAAPVVSPTPMPITSAAPATAPAGIAPVRPVIKNKTNNSAMYKMILITLGALVTTVGLGVAIGFTVLKISEKNSPLKQNVVVEKTSVPTPKAPEPTPTPAATTSATTVELKAKKILIVNATDVAGKAGKIKSALQAESYKNVATSNAKGEYTEGTNYLLMEKDDATVTAALSKDSTLTLSFNADKSVEDPKSAYDYVIVIGQK